MKIVKLEESQKTEYNNFLSAQTTNSFLQAWSWGDWQKSQNKIVERYFFIDSSEDVIGCAQIIFMQTPLGNYWYCPYGPIWKNNTSADLVEQSLLKFSELLKKVGDKILFLRIEPLQNISSQKLNFKKAESVQPPQSLIKNIFVPEDELMKSFHHKTRYNIRVAQKHDITVQTYSEFNKDVIELIMQTSTRQDYRNHASSYIENLWKFFSSQPNDCEIKVTGYLAKKGEAPAASGLMIDFAQTRMYLFGGSNYSLRNYMSPYLMHWQAMLDAKKSGLGFYDFGAAEDASGHSGGYARFKMGFNPEIVDFFGTHDIVFKKAIYSIYRSLRKANRLVLHLPFVK